MNFSKLFNSVVGKYIISILLGLGLASLFRRVCSERSCLTFKGAKLTDIDNKIFKFNNKCYSFKNAASSCDTSKKQVHFA
tara:strand:- start:247 stop:486 length:240 start_codon:yes stop_codon:yes gene_type:complete